MQRCTVGNFLLIHSLNYRRNIILQIYSTTFIWVGNFADSDFTLKTEDKIIKCGSRVEICASCKHFRIVEKQPCVGTRTQFLMLFGRFQILFFNPLEKNAIIKLIWKQENPQNWWLKFLRRLKNTECVGRWEMFNLEDKKDKTLTFLEVKQLTLVFTLLS